MTTATVKKWADFQHYKNRCPPWIKLQKSILDDFEFACLPLASKALAPLLWLLASESMDGSVRIDPDWLAFRLRFTVADIETGLTPLIDKGFLVLASGVLAPCLQDACLEGEAEAEGEKEIPPAVPAVVPADPIKKPKAKRPPTLTDWLASLDGADAIPENDPVYAYAERTGIPDEFLALSWASFKDAYTASGKRQKDFPATYRNAVKGNWYKLWWFDTANGGECRLTTAGEQARRAAE